ncbi:unnamed protein product [Moneuplotes crassus]|uniref:Uncharacterized protein n=1 Tax=Euplotes crassus TaxID=5936 RepID=A0AAD1UG00_EUPCR|nr:unnamed protein product [Moneuplotes crassus]
MRSGVFERNLKISQVYFMNNCLRQASFQRCSFCSPRLSPEKERCTNQRTL